MANGPVTGDIAHAVWGVLMWSRLPTDQAVDAIFATYGDAADRRLLGPAMAVYWFRNCWWSRDELERDERHREALYRQPDRLRTVLAYVNRVGE